VNKARERIRTATGRDGNGLKDAARKVSEAVRARINRPKQATEKPGPKDGNVGPSANRPPGRERADQAAEMAREKVNKVKDGISGRKEEARPAAEVGR
jgi:hypothetical protein